MKKEEILTDKLKGKSYIWCVRLKRIKTQRTLLNVIFHTKYKEKQHKYDCQEWKVKKKLYKLFLYVTQTDWNIILCKIKAWEDTHISQYQHFYDCAGLNGVLQKYTQNLSLWPHLKIGSWQI